MIEHSLETDQEETTLTSTGCCLYPHIWSLSASINQIWHKRMRKAVGLQQANTVSAPPMVYLKGVWKQPSQHQFCWLSANANTSLPSPQHPVKWSPPLPLQPTHTLPGAPTAWAETPKTKSTAQDDAELHKVEMTWHPPYTYIQTVLLSLFCIRRKPSRFSCTSLPHQFFWCLQHLQHCSEADSEA